MANLLTASDRCDRCGAQAYAESMHDGFTLLWCAHHLQEHRDKILPDLTLDQTHLLRPAKPEKVSST